MAVVIALLLTGLGGDVRAEGPPDSGATLAKRVVSMFDFEERQRGNFEDMPRHWYRIHQEGFPRYTLENTAFDNTVAHSGTHSLKLELNGGSAGAVLETGAIAAMPGANYIISAHVRTTDLRHARAMVVAYFCDDFGRIIEPSIVRSPLTASHNRWMPVKLELTGNQPRAAWIVLQVLLLQPDHFPGAALRQPGQINPAVTRQDITGSAWFDDVAIYQLPRISLATQTATNIIRHPDQPQFAVEVRDLTGQKLTADVSVYDHAGRRVDRMQRKLGSGQSPSWTWRPKLPKYGWYWADLQVHAARNRVGRRLVAMAYMPALSSVGRAEATRFAILAEDLPAPQRKLLIDTLNRIGTGAVTLNVWDSSTRLHQTLDTTAPDPLIRQLLDGGYQVTLCLADVPQELALVARADVNRPLGLFTRDPALWRDPLERLLIRYGRDAMRWQIGRTGSGEAFRRQDLSTLYPRISQLFQRYIAQPSVLLPWQANEQVSHDLHGAAGLTMDVPVGIEPDTLADYRATWPASIGELTLALQTLKPPHYSHATRAEDLALRMIRAWQTQPDRLAIRRPWSSARADASDILPDPLLCVWSNVAGQLSERRVVGRINAGGGIECLILEGAGPASSSIVAWKRANPTLSVDKFELYLGRNPELMDIWGNTKPAELADGRHVVPVTTTPVFVRNINVNLAKLRASFRLEPDFAESRYKVHEHDLVVANPWPRVLAGRLRITGPEHWRINPSVINFSIPGGEEVRVPLEIVFPISELSGEKQVTAVMEFDADQNYRVELATPMRVGLRHILMQPTASVEEIPGTDGDVLVTLMITNIGTEPQSLYAYAVAPDQPRQERVVSSLPGGQYTIKKFRFANCGKPLAGKQLRVGLREMDGPAMLNKMVQLP
jgi:hypothetical protein